MLRRSVAELLEVESDHASRPCRPGSPGALGIGSRGRAAEGFRPRTRAPSQPGPACG
jgi:hypothetical protein